MQNWNLSKFCQERTTWSNSHDYVQYSTGQNGALILYVKLIYCTVHTHSHMHFATNNLRCTTSSPLNSRHTFPVQFHYYCIWITVLKIQKSGRIILLSQLRIRILAKQTVKNILNYFNKNRNKGGWQHCKLQVWTNNYRKRKHAGSTATVTGL